MPRRHRLRYHTLDLPWRFHKHTYELKDGKPILYINFWTLTCRARQHPTSCVSGRPTTTSLEFIVEDIVAWGQHRPPAIFMPPCFTTTNVEVVWRRWQGFGGSKKRIEVRDGQRGDCWLGEWVCWEWVKKGQLWLYLYLAFNCDFTSILKTKSFASPLTLLVKIRISD